MDVVVVALIDHRRDPICPDIAHWLHTTRGARECAQIGVRPFPTHPGELVDVAVAAHIDHRRDPICRI